MLPPAAEQPCSDLSILLQTHRRNSSCYNENSTVLCSSSFGGDLFSTCQHWLFSEAYFCIYSNIKTQWDLGVGSPQAGLCLKQILCPACPAAPLLRKQQEFAWLYSWVCIFCHVFFSQGCLGITYLNNRLKMHCAARSLEIAAPLFEHGYPSSSVKGTGFSVTISQEESALSVRKLKPDALCTAQTRGFFPFLFLFKVSESCSYFRLKYYLRMV